MKARESGMPEKENTGEGILPAHQSVNLKIIRDEGEEPMAEKSIDVLVKNYELEIFHNLFC